MILGLYSVTAGLSYTRVLRVLTVIGVRRITFYMQIKKYLRSG